MSNAAAAKTQSQLGVAMPPRLKRQLDLTKQRRLKRRHGLANLHRSNGRKIQRPKALLLINHYIFH
jgi:hypothetical protein